MIGILQIVIGLLVLGVLVLIHELGHFIAAKSFGIRVLSFSIGFGKVIFKKEYKGTEYRISSVPFGGYVHMAGEHPEDEQKGEDSDFMAKPIWQRAVVAIAGPAANIVTSFLFLWIVFMGGVERELFLDDTTIGAITKDTPAKSSGLKPGDKILSINGKDVNSWEEINQELAFQYDEYDIAIIRNGVDTNMAISGELMKKSDRLKVPAAGLIPPYPALIGAVSEGSPAEVAGLKAGDTIIAIDNQSIHSWYQIPGAISAYNEVLGALQIIVKRNDFIQVLNVEPKMMKEENRYIVGITVAPPQTQKITYSPIVSISKAWSKTVEYTGMIFTVLKKLVTGGVSPKQLAGPVGIVQMSGTVAFGGLFALLNFMALIGINLGVVNLFPLVITDGGLLSLLLVEAIRRKPLSLKTQLFLNRTFMLLFLALFMLVTFNDILRVPLLMMTGK